MSSVGVVTQKKSKCFVRKKNLSVRRKIFKVWRGGKNVSVEFRVFGKKEIERKSSSCWGKKIKVFSGEN